VSSGKFCRFFGSSCPTQGAGVGGRAQGGKGGKICESMHKKPRVLSQDDFRLTQGTGFYLQNRGRILLSQKTYLDVKEG